VFSYFGFINQLKKNQNLFLWRTTLETKSEKEILRGKLTGFFNKRPIVLTTKRIIVGEPEEESINLSGILEAYAEQDSIASKLILRLKNGETIEYKICPEEGMSILALGAFDLGEGEMRAKYKSTCDRWVNLINRYLKP
jgi:hypothetical protein